MNTYLLLKMLHVTGVVLFLGNIIVTGWWKTMANRTGDPRVIAFAQRQVTVTDWIFTFGGVTLLAGAGYANALLHGLPLSTPWIATAHLLFVASGVIWVAVLIPLQIALARMARAFAHGGAIPARYWKLEKLWAVAGVIATLLPFANLYYMVVKPA